MILRGRLTGFQRQRLAVLLDMLYTPSELAGEIGVTPRHVLRVWLPLGCPSIREGSRVFINGVACAEWYEVTYPKTTLQNDEGFCLTCKKAVKISDCEEKKKGRLIYMVFNCAYCGRKISRILERI